MRGWRPGAFRSTGVPLSQPAAGGPRAPPPGIAGRSSQAKASARQLRRAGDGRRPARRGGRAHVRPEPGPARGARAVDRRGQGPDHPGQLPGRHQHRHARRRRRDAQRRELHAQRQHLLGARVLPARLERQARLHQRRRRSVSRSAATASSTSTTCWSRKRCSSPSPTASTSTQFDSRDENIVDALNVLYAGQTQYRGELWPHNCHIDLQLRHDADRPLPADQPRAARRPT